MATGDADGDPAAVTFAYAWKVNGTVIAETTAALSSAFFAEGDVVRCVVTPSDGIDEGTPVESNAVAIGDAPPSVTSATLSPASPSEESVLTCAAGVTSAPDGDAVTVAYAWLVNGTMIGATTDTLDGSAFARGDVVQCRVTPDDGMVTGMPVLSNTATVINTAPTADTTTVGPSGAGVTSTLTCTPGASADADGDDVTFAYAWTIDDVLVDGATAATLTTGFARGDDVRCIVTPSDGASMGPAITSSPLTIQNTLPTQPGASIAPVSPRADQALQIDIVTPAFDADGDAVTYHYVWQVQGVLRPETGATLEIGAYRKGDVVTWTIIPNDGFGDGVPFTDAVTINNTPPGISSVSITPATPTETSTLTCTPTGLDYDGDALSYSFEWFVNNVVVGGASSSTLTGAQFSKGDIVRCAAVADDGTALSTAVDATVTIANAAPELTSVTLTPPAATETSTLTCNASATDPDGDVITYAYNWTLNGVLISATTSTLDGASFDPGDTVMCRATPTDGITAGAALVSNEVVIQP